MIAWYPIDRVEANRPVLVLYANANPPYYDVAVLHHEKAEDDYYHWQNCIAGWLQDKPCVIDYIDEIEEPTHWTDLLPPD